MMICPGIMGPRLNRRSHACTRSTKKVSWNVWANHSGGYRYALPLPLLVRATHSAELLR
jgi:hypothetical protein